MGEHQTPAALAEQVDALRQRLDTAIATIRTWELRLEREGIGATLVVRLQVKKLDRKVTEFEAALADAIDKGKIKPPPAPWWDGLTAAEHAEQLTELGRWVDGFLCVQYPGYSLPACWPNHREALWELSTLHAEWQRIYADPDNRELDGALWWHERWLPGTLARLARSITCDSAGCRTPGAPRSTAARRTS